MASMNDYLPSFASDPDVDVATSTYSGNATPSDDDQGVSPALGKSTTLF